MKPLERDPNYKENLQRGYNVPKDGIYPPKPEPSQAPPPKYVTRLEGVSNER